MALRARTAAGLTLLAAGALIAWSPRVAFGPGAMAPGHTRLADDCLACHSPLRGVPADACIKCHAPGRIGTRPPARPLIVRLHETLGREDCLACHSEHRGTPTPRFDHARLPPDQRQSCAACHLERRPADALHAQAGDACGACHATRAWTPATFAHERFFVLDRDHAVACRTCHDTAAGFAAYTCYGCHEHAPARLQAEHAEEGIRDLSNCVRCHRSADEHAAREGGEREGRRGRGRHDGRDDD